MIHEVTTFDLVELDDDIDQSPKVGTLSDAFQLADDIIPNITLPVMTDSMVWTDEMVQEPFSLWNREFEDTLEFAEEIFPKVRIGDLEDFLFVYDVLALASDHIFPDTLEFTDDFSGIQAVPVEDTLDFADSMTYIFELNPVFSDTLTTLDAIHLYFPDPWRPMVPIVPEVP
jgi:hypothetical protein